MRFSQKWIEGELLSVASVVCRTKMCPQLVRLVVVRTQPKKSKPYRYFVVFTTDLQLSVESILVYYRLRWGISSAFRDAKQNLGFDEYQVKSEKSINRFVQLSFVATRLIQWVFIKSAETANPTEVEPVIQTLGIHWYHPTKLTRGLMIAYLRFCHFAAPRPLFSAIRAETAFSSKDETFAQAA